MQNHFNISLFRISCLILQIIPKHLQDIKDQRNCQNCFLLFNILRFNLFKNYIMQFLNLSGFLRVSVQTETDSGSAEESQVIYRTQRCRRAALELNTEAFMKICIPSNEVWNKFGWRGKGVSQIISQIVDNGVPTSTIPKKNNLCKKF